jgi:hypothetical protein
LPEIKKEKKTYRVCVQGLEQADDLAEKVDGLVTLLVVGVAAGFNGVDASTVGSPLVLPEGLGILVVALPVLLHVAEGVGLAGGLEEGRDVIVFTR